ncbi:MAG TPA: ABC transporter permease [bacterium]|nr:ABC transporter permease [bacterium]
MRGVVSPAVIRVASVLVGLAAWEIYGRTIHTVIFAYPSQIARAFVELARTGELWFYLQGSLVVLALGLGLAIAIGIPLGIVMGRRAAVEYALEPYINALYSTPTVALIPLIVLWAGFQVKAKVILVFLFCVFPILINTFQGVKNTDAKLLEVARSFSAGEWSMWRDLMVPSAAPYILAGIRLGIGRGLVGMIVAEFYTAITGLGYMIVQYANNFRTDRLFVPIVVLMVLGIGLTSLLRRIERSLAPWLHVAQHE